MPNIVWLHVEVVVCYLITRPNPTCMGLSYDHGLRTLPVLGSGFRVATVSLGFREEQASSCQTNGDGNVNGHLDG